MNNPEDDVIEAKKALEHGLAMVLSCADELDRCSVVTCIDELIKAEIVYILTRMME